MASATTTWRARAGRRQRSGSRAVADAAATGRRAARSARPRPGSSARGRRPRPSPTARRRPATADRARGGDRRRRDQRRAQTPAKATGPALKARAARLPHIQYSRRAVARRRRPSTARAAPAAPPTRSTRTARTPSTTAEGGERGGDERTPSPRDHEHRDRQQGEQRQAVGEHHAAAEQQPASTDHGSERRTAPQRQRAHPPRRERREHRVRGHALPDRGRADHQERRGQPGVLLGAQRPQRDEHRDGGRRREQGDDEARRPVRCRGRSAPAPRRTSARRAGARRCAPATDRRARRPGSG